MKLTFNVSDELVVNCIDSADIGYWAKVPSGADTADMLAGKASATIEEYGDEDQVVESFQLTGKKIRHGLKIMAEKYPHHLNDLLADNSDAWTGDTLIQCSLFGELRYG